MSEANVQVSQKMLEEILPPESSKVRWEVWQALLDLHRRDQIGEEKPKTAALAFAWKRSEGWVRSRVKTFELLRPVLTVDAVVSTDSPTPDCLTSETAWSLYPDRGHKPLYPAKDPRRPKVPIPEDFPSFEERNRLIAFVEDHRLLAVNQLRQDIDATLERFSLWHRKHDTRFRNWGAVAEEWLLRDAQSPPR